MWKLIKENGFLWKGNYDKSGKWKWDIKIDTLIFTRLREHWDIFEQVASGEADKSFLPTWPDYKPAQRSNPKADMDFAPPLEDDDIPF